MQGEQRWTPNPPDAQREAGQVYTGFMQPGGRSLQTLKEYCTSKGHDRARGSTAFSSSRGDLFGNYKAHSTSADQSWCLQVSLRPAQGTTAPMTLVID